MEEDEKKDLKQGENDTQEKESDSKNESAEDSDGLKEKEDSKAKAEKLLDGTDKNKKIVVKKGTYDERNEKAKIYEAHAELLDQVLKDPDTVKKFLKEKDGGNIETRVEQLERERKTEKREKLREAVSEMLTDYPDFEQSWDEVKPIADALMAQGYSPKAAIRRGYLASHPEAAEKEIQRIADDALNREGEFRGGGLPSRQNIRKTELSDDENKIAEGLIRQGTVKSKEEYSKILDKHRSWIDQQIKNIGE